MASNSSRTSEYLFYQNRSGVGQMSEQPKDSGHVDENPMSQYNLVVQCFNSGVSLGSSNVNNNNNYHISSSSGSGSSSWQ